jgi:hypothetical protein
MYLAHKYIGTYESITKCEMNSMKNPITNSIAEKLSKNINGINPKEYNKQCLDLILELEHLFIALL